MSRVDELGKRYPSIPRQYIVRWDAKVHGMKDTGKLDEFGYWRQVGKGYVGNNFDITLKDWVEARPGRQKQGLVLRPGQFVLPENGLRLSDWINTKSDLETRHEGNGKFALYQGDERVEEVLLSPRKKTGENLTSTGKPESEFLSWNTNTCFYLTAVRHCEYFPRGVACKFCDLNPGQDVVRSIGIERPITANLEDTVEDYRSHASQVRVVEGTFSMGGLTKSEGEVGIFVKLIEKFASATPYEPYFRITTQPMERKNLQRLKDAGLKSANYHPEIWDPELFAEVVPGKAQYRGRERYLEAFEEAVDVLGAGNVRCQFVGGLSLIPENGHKTWQEARDSMNEGNTWMIKRGIVPVAVPLYLPPGSAWGNEEYRKKIPPTEYYLEVALAHHEACKEYGLYDKLNRMICCPIDVLENKLGIELGAYEIAGTLGNWAAAVLPREANWHLDWEEKRKGVTTTQ